MPDDDLHRIDSHKLHLHPGRVADWLEGRETPPIYLELSPSGACNHRCVFCCVDFLGYKPRFMPQDILARRLVQLGEMGVKAVMYAGDGEPFLHPAMGALTEATKKAGIDVAFTTNAVPLKPAVAEMALPHSSWIKISLNAGRAETYARVHGTSPDDFYLALRNAEFLMNLRARTGAGCAVGFQMLLLPENRAEAADLAATVRDLGADYLVVKPYAVHHKSLKTAYLDLVYDDDSELRAALAALNTPEFKVVFRREAMRRSRGGPGAYGRCLALPFWAYVTSDGEAWTCARHIGDPACCYGNLLATPPDQFLLGPARREQMESLTRDLDIKDCHTNCRMDPINAYLWELRHPGPHVNFI